VCRCAGSSRSLFAPTSKSDELSGGGWGGIGCGGGADAEGSGGRSRAPEPRTSLDREAVEASTTGRDPDVKPPSPHDEVRGSCRSTPPTGCCSIQSGARVLTARSTFKTEQLGAAPFTVNGEIHHLLHLYYHWIFRSYICVCFSYLKHSVSCVMLSGNNWSFIVMPYAR
jgi:hypothetical protein